MKLYGSRRHDGARCEWGCCGGKLTRRFKGSASEKRARRAARKRARREQCTSSAC
jgi:hypothetical protein